MIKTFPTGRFPWSGGGGGGGPSGLPSDVWFVSKAGDDANDGLTRGEPKLTIASAIAAAKVVTPTSAKWHCIRIIDGGVYEEDIALDTQYLCLTGPVGTVKGSITLVDETYADIAFAIVPAGKIGALKIANGGISGYRCKRMSVLGNGIGIVYTSGDIEVDIEHLTIENGAGFGNASASGSAWARIDGIYVTGTGVAVANVGGGNLALNSTRIYAPSGTCITNTGTSHLDITSSQINGSVAYTNTSTGHFHINCLDITGTRIGRADIATTMVLPTSDPMSGLKADEGSLAYYGNAFSFKNGPTDNDWVALSGGSGGTGITPVIASVTYTVGTAGTYLTMTAALEDITKTYALAYKLGATAGIKVILQSQAGYVWADQIVADGIDLSWIQIDSTDATTTVLYSALTFNLFTEIGTNSYPIVAAINGGKSPLINTQFSMLAPGTTTDRHGFVAASGGEVLIKSGGCSFADVNARVFPGGRITGTSQSLGFSSGLTYGIHVNEGILRGIAGISATSCGENVFVENDGIVHCQGYFNAWTSLSGAGVHIKNGGSVTSAAEFVARDCHTHGIHIEGDGFAGSGGYMLLRNCIGDGILIDGQGKVQSGDYIYTYGAGGDGIHIEGPGVVSADGLVSCSDYTYRTSGNGIYISRGGVVYSGNRVKVEYCSQTGIYIYDGGAVYSYVTVSNNSIGVYLRGSGHIEGESHSINDNNSNIIIDGDGVIRSHTNVSANNAVYNGIQIAGGGSISADAQITATGCNRIGILLEGGGEITAGSYVTASCDSSSYPGVQINGSGKISAVGNISVTGTSYGAILNGGSITSKVNLGFTGPLGGLICQGGRAVAGTYLNCVSTSGAGIHVTAGGLASAGTTMEMTAGTYGVLAEYGGKVTCVGAMDNSGAGTAGAQANGGEIIAASMDNTGTSGIGANSIAGRIVTTGAMNNQQNSVDSPTDTQVTIGGQVIRGSGNGGISQAAGTMTANGYINV